jgi:hypothetical protein
MLETLAAWSSGCSAFLAAADTAPARRRNLIHLLLVIILVLVVVRLLY